MGTLTTTKETSRWGRWWAEHKDDEMGKKRKEYWKEYRKNHREYYLQKNRESHKKTYADEEKREYMKIAARKFYWEHCDELRKKAREYYKKNKAIITEKTKVARALYRDTVLTPLKTERGGSCEECGYNEHIEILEWHHLNPAEKDGNVSMVSRSMLAEEVKKCALLCPNCHRLAHRD